MGNKEMMRPVTIRELWALLVQKLWILLLAALIAAGTVFAVLRMTYTPLYSSTATLYILRQNEDADADDTADDFSLALKVVNDCTYLLKSRTVLNAVIEDLALELSYEQLEGAVSAVNPENTRILEVTVKAASPELAKAIVDRVCGIGQDSITEAMGFRQVNLFEHGTYDPEPCNTPSAAVYVLAAVSAAVLVYLVFLTVYLLDDGIKTAEDMEKVLGISLLGEIPDLREAEKMHYNDSYFNPRYGKNREK